MCLYFIIHVVTLLCWRQTLVSRWPLTGPVWLRSLCLTITVVRCAAFVGTSTVLFRMTLQCAMVWWHPMPVVWDGAGRLPQHLNVRQMVALALDAQPVLRPRGRTPGAIVRSSQTRQDLSENVTPRLILDLIWRIAYSTPATSKDIRLCCVTRWQSMLLHVRVKVSQFTRGEMLLSVVSNWQIFSHTVIAPIYAILKVNNNKQQWRP